MKETFERIIRLTKEMVRNDWTEYYASLVEEIGELAAALKTEEGLVKHKTLDESSAGEAADVAICAIMMYSVLGGELENLPSYNAAPVIDRSVANFGPFSLLAEIMGPAGMIGQAALAIPIMNKEMKTIVVGLGIGQGSPSQLLQRFSLDVFDHALQMFVMRQRGGIESFEKIINEKLDKWERHNKAGSNAQEHI